MVKHNHCFNAGFAYRLIVMKKREPSDRQLLGDGGVSWRVRNHVKAGWLDQRQGLFKSP